MTTTDLAGPTGLAAAVLHALQGRHVYAGTVPEAVVRRRRQRNKAAARQRVINRRRRSS